MDSMKRGQGAMEYLMSYGWAIMIVMIVGIAMYRLDIFNMGDGMAPTAQGFSTLKPLLSTCQMGTGLFATMAPPSRYDGFQCQFVNAAGGPIRIRDIDLRVDDRYCKIPVVQNTAVFTAGESIFVYRYCPFEDDCLVLPSCLSIISGFGFCAITGEWLPIGRDEPFVVMSVSDINPASAAYQGPCSTLEREKKYIIDIDITYDIDVGGVTSTKHSTGTVTLSG